MFQQELNVPGPSGPNTALDVFITSADSPTMSALSCAADIVELLCYEALLPGCKQAQTTDYTIKLDQSTVLWIVLNLSVLLLSKFLLGNWLSFACMLQSKAIAC